MVAHVCIPSRRQEEHEFKASLGYIGILRPAWATQ
jgi:hypothetical protein